MPGLGLQGAYGVQGAQGALRQRLIDRMAQEQQAQQMAIQQQRMAQQQQQMKAEDEDRYAARQERAATSGRLQTTALNAELSQLSPETEISSGTQQRMVQGGVLPERMSPVGITPQAPPPALAAVDQAPDEPMPGTIANSAQPEARKYLRVRTAPEQTIKNTTDREAAATQRLLANFPAGSRARAAVEYEAATNKNAPASMYEPAAKPGVIHDTPEGLVRIADNGTVTPLGVQGYHAPVDTSGRDLRDQLTREKLEALQAERAKAEKAQTDKDTSARDATQYALTLADRLEKHPGLSMASGNISSRFSGWSQSATDANAIRDQLVAALALPNLGTLKGPMSDKDVVFVKLLATRLGNPLMSETETRKAITEAKAFLRNKSDAQGGTQTAKRVRFDENGDEIP